MQPETSVGHREGAGGKGNLEVRELVQGYVITHYLKAPASDDEHTPVQVMVANICSFSPPSQLESGIWECLSPPFISSTCF